MNLLQLISIALVFVSNVAGITVAWNITLPSSLNSQDYHAITFIDKAVVIFQMGPLRHPSPTNQVVVLDAESGSLLFSYANYYIYDYDVATGVFLAQSYGKEPQLEGIAMTSGKRIFRSLPLDQNFTQAAIVSVYVAGLDRNGVVRGFVLDPSEGRLFGVWTFQLSGLQIYGVVRCANNFCISTSNGIMCLDTKTGKALWSMPGARLLSDSHTIVDPTSSFVVVGADSGFLPSNVLLLDSLTGKQHWNVSLGAYHGAFSLTYHYKTQIVLATYVAMGKKRNAYPSYAAGLRVSDGHQLFYTGSRSTMAPSSYFPNGDYVYLNDNSVARYQGSSGNVVCRETPIQAYGISTIAATNTDSFVALSFSFGWQNLFVYRVKCF